MKRVLFIIGIVLLVLILGFQLILMIAPFETSDFLLTFNTDRYLLFTREGVVSVDLRQMAEGVTPEDRLFLQRKRKAFETLVLGLDKYEEELAEYHKALIAAGEDGTLTLPELEALKQLHSDIVPDEYVNDWQGLAKKYLPVIRKEKRRTKYDYLQW